MSFRARLKHAFAIPSERDLTDRQRQWLEHIARAVADRGLTTPALLLLGSAKPLSFVGGQTLSFFEPLLSVAVPAERCREAAHLLENRAAVGFLMDRIEACARAQKRDGGG